MEPELEFGRLYFACPHCGRVAVDEDGCCRLCGADAPPATGMPPTKISKQESELRSKFMIVAKADPVLSKFVLIRHEDVRTGGIADLEVVGNRRTTHWEFKHATPEFESPGLQELMMLRLAGADHARYIVFWQSRHGIGKRTMIVHPREVHNRKNWLLVPEEVTPGFDMKWLCRQIAEAHRV